jgi:hypothetical protein
MKILRVRRGYTTNSSGANEWVPPSDAKYNKKQQAQETDSAQPGDSEQAPAEQGAAAPPTPAKQVTILATQPQATQEQSATTTQPAQTSTRIATNLGIMGLLIGAVCSLFVLTAWLRRKLGGKK